MSSFNLMSIIAVAIISLTALADLGSQFEINKKTFVSLCARMSETKLLECEVRIGEAIVAKPLSAKCPVEIQFEYSSSKDRQKYEIRKHSVDKRAKGYERVDQLVEQIFSNPDGGSAMDELRRICGGSGPSGDGARVQKNSID